MVEAIGNWILISGAIIWAFYLHIVLLPRMTLVFMIISLSKLPENWLWLGLFGGVIDIIVYNKAD
jgi:hypothetical protein